MPPGPTIIGIAKGTTAAAVLPILSTLSSKSTFSWSGFAGLPSPFIMLIAIKNTSTPPATWNEPTEIPNILNSPSPATVKKVMVIKTVKLLIRAKRRLSVIL